jgi:methylmalonyl-CoA mutase
VGLPPAQTLKRFSFGLALGTDILVEASKIAALRILWQRLSEVLGQDVELANEIYTLPSLRFFSGRDTQNNLLRTTLMALSAALGGAQGFKCIPYDALTRKKSPDAMRLSTNIPLLLKQEGFVSGVQNMLDGAPLFEKTTASICEKAWMFFQEVEKKGGLFEAVRSGWLQTELKRQEEYSKNLLCYFQKEIIGVNKYVVSQSIDETVDKNSLMRLSDIIDPLFLTKSPDDYLTVEPLVVNSVCYDWDVVQIRSDQYRHKTGTRPRIQVIKGGGPVVEKKLTWLSQIFSVAGFEMEVQSAEPTSWSAMNQEALVIIVPSHDEMEETVALQLRQQSRARIWSCNTLKDTSKVDKFLQTDVNILEIIKEMQSLVLEGV